MIDRTDLQLMLAEEIFEADMDTLIDLFRQLTGEDVEVCDEETEEMTGSVDKLQISDPRQLKKCLGFLLYALGERIEIPAE